MQRVRLLVEKKMENKGNELFALLKKTNPLYIKDICRTLLQSASKHGHSEIVKMIVESFREYVHDWYVKEAYCNAFRRQDIKTMAALGPRLSTMGYEHVTYFGDILGNICEISQVDADIEFFRYCAENKYVPIDLSYGNNYLIRVAASKGNAKLVAFLLTYPTVDPTLRGGDHPLAHCLYFLDKCRMYSKERCHYIETVRVLLSDARVNNLLLLEYYRRNPYLNDGEIGEMWSSAYKRRERDFNYKMQALPKIIPKDMCVLIVAQSTLTEAVQSGNYSVTVDLVVIAHHFNLEYPDEETRQAAWISHISNYIDSFFRHR